MKILAIEKELSGAATADFKKIGKEEAKVLWDLYQSGFVREFYFRSDKDAAVLILEAESIAAARKKLNRLPFVNKKLIKFELIPLKPYPGFERLFV
jgi:hypothetical protein